MDITERRQAEEALQRAYDELEMRVHDRTAQLRRSMQNTTAERQQLYDVLETLPVYVCLLTPGYRMLFANRVFRETFGYDPNRTCYEFLFDCAQPCENCRAYDVLKTHTAQRWEWTGPNGRIYDVYDYPFKDTDGSTLILEMGADVTEQKSAQKSLLEASRYARRLIEASPDPLVTISSEGKITDVNEATVIATGLSRQELIGTRFSSYFTEPAEAETGYRKVFSEGSVTDYPLTIRHKEGGLMDVLYRATVYRNEAGEIAGIFAAARDITERKKAEEAVRQQAAQLRALASQLNRTERKERRRLSKILHDHIQQLIVAARMQLSWLKSDDNPQRQATVQAVDAILSETLDALRSLTVDLSPPILQESGLIGGLGWLAARMRDKNQFTVHMTSDSAAEPASEEIRFLLFECARELLFNALKHSGIREAQVTLQRLGQDRIQLTVSDEGNGFDAALLDRRAADETTFGLFSIRERLAHLGGQMAIDTAPGRGARFTLTVQAGLAQRPHVHPSAEPMSRHAAQEQGSPAQVRVLVCDDHKIVREGLSRLLQYDPQIEVVAQAADGPQAIELAARYRPDVVVLDVNLGEMSGIEATRRILQAAPGARVIGLSMHEDTTIARAMHDAGAAAYLTKTGPSEDLIATVKSCGSR